MIPTPLYGLASVSVTAGEILPLVSTISHHLRTVMRIHDKGTSNQVILQRAGIDVSLETES